MQVPNDEPESNPQPSADVPNDEQQQQQQDETQLQPSEPNGDYMNVHSRPLLLKILQRQGDNHVVLFADKVLKFTLTGKMKRRILIITDFVVYIIDPITDELKRRIALAAVDRLCLSEFSDNFFSVIISTEYDLLLASTRKTEIATLLFEAIKSSAQYELQVSFSNRFEYNATASLIEEIQFEEIEGM